MDAITMLREDHRTVEKLFKQFEKTKDDGERRTLVEQMIRELSIHAAVEEQAFYPAVRRALPDVEPTVLEGLEEHHIVKWTLSELDGMAPTEERFEAKVTVLMESVRHHVEEEEQEMFPEVRKAMGRKALADLGATMEAVRKAAPTRPHPKAPDTPPGNLANLGAAVVDRVKDAASGRSAGAKKPTTGGKTAAKKPAAKAKATSKS